MQSPGRSGPVAGTVDLVDFRVLGPLEVAEGGHLLALGGPKQRTVLGLLLLQANEVVTVDGLVEGLWGSEPPPAARNSLQSYVSRLRTLLGSDRIESRAAGYVLRADPDEVDLQRFEQLVYDARARVATDPREVVADLDRALQLWRGPPLADLADSAAPAAEVARLDELRLLAVEDRVEARLATGLQADVVAELETLTRQHPLRERLWGQLMIALFRSGRQAEALQAYTRLRSVLADELGADPGPRLQQLHRRILVQDPALHPSERPRHNLPAAISTFVGRDEELREVAAFLADARLTTLVGAGGIGKTRLAVEAARDALGHFPDGVWLVDLAPLDDPASVLPAVGAALGVEERTGRSMREVVVEHVRPRRLLLVLDNCEHLVDETARTARTLLEVAPDVSILATSRVALEMPGETVWRVPSMALPGTDGGAQTLQAIDTDAVQLFAQRARSARPDLTFGHDTTTIAVEICTRLDGIPLAIELAAARATPLPLPEIARGLEDRFRFLTRGARAALPRHRTLRAMVDWGYGLLTPGEQELFDHLSVFAGSFDLNAVAAVADHGGTLDDVRARLDGLVAASMVIPHEAGADTPRYRLLETPRQYGADRLEERGESARLRERHAGVYARRAQQAAAMLRTADPERWLERVEVDLDNLRVALDWSVIRAAADNALTLVPAFCEFAVRRGRMTEWRAPVERALEVGSSGSPSVRAAALTAAGFLLYQLGEYERAEQVDDEAVRLCRATDDTQGLVEALNRRGHLAIFADGDFDTAAACFQESLALCDEYDYPRDGRGPWPSWHRSSCSPTPGMTTRAPASSRRAASSTSSTTAAGSRTCVRS